LHKGGEDMANNVIAASLTLDNSNFQTNMQQSANSMDDFQRQSQRARTQLNNFASSAAGHMRNLAAGAASLAATGLVALGSAAAATFTEMEKSLGKLEAQTGETGEGLKELETSVKNVFTSGFGESIEEVSDAVAKVYQTMGNLPQDEMESMTKSVFTLSQAFEADVTESTRAAQQLMQQFGVSSEDAMDMLTTAFQRGGNYTDELLSTVFEYSTVFSNMGYSAEQMMGMFVDGAASGIWSLDKLGDATKESFLQITDGADNTKEAVKELGLNYNQINKDIQSGGDKANGAFIAVMTAISGVEDAAKRNALAVELMGTPIEDLGPQFQSFFAGVGEGMTGFEGAAEKAADALKDNFGDRMQIVWRQFKTGAAEAFASAGGGELLDSIASAAEKMVPIVQNMVTEVINFANTIKDNWGTIVKVITPIAAAVGALYLQLGAVAAVNAAKKAIDALKASTLVTTIAQHGFNAALRANPIGAVITAITLLIGAGVLLYQNWDVVTEKAGQLWEWLKKVWAGIEKGFSAAWNAVQRAAGAAMNFMIDGVNSVIGLINKIPGVEIEAFGKVSWGQDNLPKNALGTSYFSGGPTLIHERGGEIIDLPNGSRIYPHDKSVQMARNESSQTNHFTINAKGVTANEVINEVVPQLKLALSNM
jgi:phage-related minor tail protein